MFPRSSLDPPLEMESLLAGWIYILSMLAVIYGCLQALTWPDRKEGSTPCRDVFNEVFNLTAIEMSVNCVDSHVEAYFFNPS